MHLLRTYQPNDYPMLCKWCEGHKRNPPPEACLPPIGVVVKSDGQDIVCLFLYIAQGVGVCFVEHLTSKPGMTSKKTREATVAACSYLKNLARDMGCWLMIAHTVQGIARLMVHEGWHKADSEDTKLSAMFTTTEGA